MKIERTERGLPCAEFVDKNGSLCSIQDSSLAPFAGEDWAIRLGSERDYRGVEAIRMHLTQSQVRDLLPLLQRFADTGSIEQEKGA